MKISAIALITLTTLMLASPLESATQQQSVSLKCGALIDVKAKKVLGPTTVNIVGNKISSVGKTDISTNSKVIDLSDHTCLPGLMDMHVHLTGEFGANTYLDWFTKNTADFTIKAVNFADKTLQAGFTTIRNPGDDGTITVALRNAIARGTAKGPRIFTAGKSIATTGGHSDPSNGYRADLMGDPGPKKGVVNGAASAMKAVRQRYKEGADFIKITATGGVLSAAKNGQNPQFTQEELNALVKTANDYGFKVAAHAHGAEGMKRAIRAGVASIEHGTLMDDETIKLMKQHGTYFVPTIMAGEFVAQKSKIKGFFPEVVRPKAAALGPKIKQTFGKAYKAGVKIAFGTDSGVSAHGDNAQEFGLMVEAGMPAMEAIYSATVSTADLLDESENLGSIETGKFADIIAVKGNPVENIRLLEDVKFVMKDGVVYKDKTNSK